MTSTEFSSKYVVRTRVVGSVPDTLSSEVAIKIKWNETYQFSYNVILIFFSSEDT
jgi:hypothetical protein